jgi:response regulator RpfG family c-di-GMP phosphodiesterase
MNRRVLLVDDSPSFLDGLIQLLRARFTVHTAADGAEALALCETSGPFAVVVSDQEMPGIRGVQLLARMRESWPDTARILLTGSAELDLAVEALEEGAIFRFMTKPPLPSRLVEAVEAGIRHFRARQEERLLIDQLSFARESMLELTLGLERRLERALGRVGALESFVAGLGQAASLDEIAAQTSVTLRRLFGPRVSQALPVGQADVRLDPPIGPALPESERSILAIVDKSAALAARGWLLRRESEEVQRSTILALARLAEDRDERTGKHLERVSEYCRFLARALCEAGCYTESISEAFISDLALAAPVHDIGKVAIPDAILNKPGPLDEQEWSVMRTHAAIGAKTLEQVLETAGESRFLRMAQEIAWCHHERWDGSGYPRGLAGASIPLAARIMALADCYDALTSARPYKHAWPHAEALRYVAGERGKHFDPRIADTFLSREREVDAIRSRLADQPAASEA